jgi:hypothetical protein
MNYELALYDLTLLVVGVVNIAMATGLLMNNYTYRHYPVYHRSRMLTAVFFAVFGIGLILHYHYHWRQACPPLATALSLTYFHIAGVAVTWSHTSLLNPRYLSRRVAARDIAFLAIGIPTYWLTAMFNVPGSMFIFLLHAVWMTYDFYTAYYRISHRLRGIQSSTQHARCFRWMLLSCHLIIAFGIGSIVFTFLLPTAIWPYTVLLCVGGMVFAYIYYSISEYGAVIDYATNVAEDVGS